MPHAVDRKRERELQRRQQPQKPVQVLVRRGVPPERGFPPELLRQQPGNPGRRVVEHGTAEMHE